FVHLALFIILFNSCKENTVKSPSTISEEDNEAHSKVNDLLSQMTLEEKVGQMTQINATMFVTDGEIDEAKLRKQIVDRGLGSILNTPFNQASSLEDWRTFITTIQNIAAESRLKIPVIYGIDAIHGTTYTQNSTLFPHNIGLAATRNPELVKISSKITAKEVRASGIRWNFDPVFGVGKNPLWPRFEETYGEDTYLVGE